MVDELIFDVQDAEKLGLHSEALYVIEYDLNSRRLIPKDYIVCPNCNTHSETDKIYVQKQAELYCPNCGVNITTQPIQHPITEADKEERERYNKVANEIRNKLFFALKFQIKATKHLESSWLISKERLGDAVVQIDALKAEMARAGFDNVDKRIRIIPIMTTEDGFENYEDQKIQFLLQFCTEHIQYCDKALDEQRIAKSSLWRCKKAYEIINLLADELKSEDSRHEVKDESELLSDKVSQVEAMIQKQDEEIKANQ
jgi:transcription initiation factor TFIIIB Brf1 subunit/transcription initiation factor TFIIB